jgi:hypothetical protein
MIPFLPILQELHGMGVPGPKHDCLDSLPSPLLYISTLHDPSLPTPPHPEAVVCK